jgi:RNA polymerase sigma factor (sigma-70 family)
MDMAGTWVQSEFETVFRQHFEGLVRLTRRVLRCDAEAEEVCAEVFLKLYRSGPDVLAKGIVGGWLYRAATRAAIDRLRRNQRRGLEGELKADLSGSADGRVEDPLTRLLRGERIAEVRSALAQLKVEKAQILLLRHSGLSYHEIAETMQINAASVGTTLARAEVEFSAHYQRQQRLTKRAPRLETAKEGQ